jgi:hypothetical protein
LNKARDSRQFVLHHLPAIARKYVHVRGLDLILEDDNDVISQHLLRQIDDQIRKLIHYSNQAPVAQFRTSGAVPTDSSATKDSSTTKNKADLPAQDEVESPPKRMKCASSLPYQNSNTDSDHANIIINGRYCCIHHVRSFQSTTTTTSAIGGSQ